MSSRLRCFDAVLIDLPEASHIGDFCLATSQLISATMRLRICSSKYAEEVQIKLLTSRSR